MRIAPAVITTIALIGLAACDGSYGPYGPGGGGGGPEQTAATVADPIGDTFGGGASGGVQWDLTALTITRDTGGITVVLAFSSDVLSPVTGDTSAMIGFVDFDVDQDATTGFVAVADEFRLDGGATGMGVDFELQLTFYAADSSVAVVDSRVQEIGRVKPVFSAKRVTIRIPKVLLGNDDGFLNAAAIVGRPGRPTDFAPNTQHLRLAPSAAPGVQRRSVSLA